MPMIEAVPRTAAAKVVIGSNQSSSLNLMPPAA